VRRVAKKAHRFLFGWELGGGLGHIGRLTAAARAVQAAGHSCVLALRDLRGLATFDPGPDIPVWQAPVCIHRYDGLEEPPLNYAEVLMRFGYLDKAMLSGLVRGWQELARATDADIIIADHAPSAILAAKTLGLRCIAFGNAFTVPPLVSPTPGMRSWLQLPPGRLEGSDKNVLDNINFVLREFKAPALHHLYELFEVDDIIITNFVELDHYAHLRPAADLERISFCGPISAYVASAVAPPWPAGSTNCKRIFAYLKPDYLHLAVTLSALAACGEPCVIYGLGADCRAVPANAPNLHLSAQPIDIAKAGAESALGICHAGSTTSAMLHAGCPLLLLPTQLEQYLEGARISELGAGLVVNPEEKQPDIAGALTRLLADAQFGGRAKEFAARYRAWTPDKILSHTVACLVSAAEGKRLATAGSIA
jgi:hypothetical protein